MNNLIGYKTSSDYELLVKLMNEQIVVCEVDYNWRDGSAPTRDIAKAIYNNYGYEGDDEMLYSISSRGISYITEDDKQQFINKCKRFNVKFMLPNKDEE